MFYESLSYKSSPHFSFPTSSSDSTASIWNSATVADPTGTITAPGGVGRFDLNGRGVSDTEKMDYITAKYINTPESFDLYQTKPEIKFSPHSLKTST